MKSLADDLPLEMAKHVHPQWRANEEQYWKVRDQLLEQYKDQWIGFADGKVVAHGSIPVKVLHAAAQTGLHPYFVCVGREFEPIRIRRTVFPYDTKYPREPDTGQLAAPRPQISSKLQNNSCWKEFR